MEIETKDCDLLLYLLIGTVVVSFIVIYGLFNSITRLKDELGIIVTDYNKETFAHSQTKRNQSEILGKMEKRLRNYENAKGNPNFITIPKKKGTHPEIIGYEFDQTDSNGNWIYKIRLTETKND